MMSSFFRISWLEVKLIKLKWKTFSVLVPTSPSCNKSVKWLSTISIQSDDANDHYVNETWLKDYLKLKRSSEKKRNQDFETCWECQEQITCKELSRTKEVDIFQKQKKWKRKRLSGLIKGSGTQKRKIKVHLLKEEKETETTF